MRAIAAAIIVTLLSCPAPLAAQGAGSPAALLALHRQYAGWTFGQYATIVTQGTIAQNGSPAGTWTTREIGGAYRTQVTGASIGMPSDYGFTGRVFWDSDKNGFTRPDYSSYQGYAISRYVLLNEGTATLPGTTEGTQNVDGVQCSVVRVTPPSGDAIDLCIDRSTGAYRRAVVDPGGPYQAVYDGIEYGDFAGGKHYISAYSVDDVRYAVTSFQTNVQVSTLQLHPPMPAATWSFGDPATVPLTVTPFAWLVAATVDGVSGLFVVDSGIPDVVLSSDFAARAHVVTSGSGEITGAGIGPALHVQNAHIDTLAVGGSTLHDVAVLVGGRDSTLNASEYQSSFGTVTVNGYLGFPLFAAAVVTVDAGAKTLTIADPATTTVDRSSGYSPAVDLSVGEPRVEMTVDGSGPVLATLDTGNGAFVALSQETVDAHHIPIMASEGTTSPAGQLNYGVNSNFDPGSGGDIQNYLQSHQWVQGLGGKEEQRCSGGSKIALGPFVDESVTLCLSPSLTGDRMVVGFDFMQNFDWIFDYPEGAVVIKSHSH